MNVDSATTALNTFNKAIDRVLAQPPGAQRWRAANNLWLTLSPKNQRIYKEVVAENAMVRESVNKYGMADSKENENLRNYINIPVGAYQVIERADPDVFRAKKNSERFFKAFPEYATREIF